MLGPKGYVIIDKELKHTMEPPENVKEEYFNAMKGNILMVVDVAIDGSGYLVQGEVPGKGPFLWTVEKEDTIGEMIPYAVISQLNAAIRSLRMQDAMQAVGLNMDAISDESIDIMSKATGVDFKKILQELGVL